MFRPDNDYFDGFLFKKESKNDSFYNLDIKGFIPTENWYNNLQKYGVAFWIGDV